MDWIDLDLNKIDLEQIIILKEINLWQIRAAYIKL